MENDNITIQQRDILFEACKKVATDKKCPSWASKILAEAVKNAKNLRPGMIQDTAPELNIKHIKIGSIVKVSQHDNGNVYKIIHIGPIIQEVQLYDIEVIKSVDKELNIGYVRHNVPVTWLKLIQE